MSGRADRWIRRTTIGCVGMLALIAGTVPYLHMHLLVELHGQPGWVAVLTPLSVDGMVLAGVDHVAGRVAVRQAWRIAAVGLAGDRESGESGRERFGCGADGYGACDRGMAVIRADRRVRTADAPDPPRRRAGHGRR